MTTLFSELNFIRQKEGNKAIQSFHHKNVEALDTLFLNGFITEHEKKKILKRLSANLASKVSNLS
jgi:hypothetical protein